MLRSTHDFAARSSRLAGIIAAAALAVPAIALAQTGEGERALLNHIENPASAATAIAVRPGTRYTLIQEAVGGERALVARIPAPASVPEYFDATIAWPRANAPVTGARALLVR